MPPRKGRRGGRLLRRRGREDEEPRLQRVGDVNIAVRIEDCVPRALGRSAGGDDRKLTSRIDPRDCESRSLPCGRRDLAVDEIDVVETGPGVEPAEQYTVVRGIE